MEWRDLAIGGAVPSPAPGAGYGIKTGAAPRGSGIVVVDLDGEAAVEAWLELHTQHSTEPVPTYTVRTGRGLQLYFRHPGFPVRNSVGTLAPKIDIRGEGGFVVGPGSPHASGKSYEIVEDLEPAELPGWLLEWFRKQPAPSEIQPHVDDVTDPVERERRKAIYGTWLASEAAPCVEGQGGDVQLWKVVQKGAYDLALPAEDVLELIAEHYDPRCDPPWGDELEYRVLRKVKDAKEKTTRPRDVPYTNAEAIDLDAFYSAEIERTALVEPEPEPTDENDYGFQVKWGHWQDMPNPPEYLVDQLLVEEKVSMIFAEPGTIKSWTAIDLAQCISAGLPWLGEKLVNQAPVLYVDFEDGEYEFHRRVHLLTGGQERPDLGYVYAPGNVVEKDWWTRLGRLVEARGVRFVVIDTLAGATPGVEENDRNAADPLTYAGRLTENAKVTILFLHHANRAGDIRGTSAFKATVDTLFKLETVEDRQEEGLHRAKLTCVKSGQKKVPPVWLELTDEGLRSFTPDGKEGAPAAEGEAEKRTMEELQQEVLFLIESEGPFGSVQMIRERVKARNSTVTAILAELTATGDVYKSPEGWRRDSNAMRDARLRRVVERHPEATKGRIVADAFITKEFFEQRRREGRIRPAIVGDDSGGFIWIEA